MAETMIDVKVAVNAAKEYISSFLGLDSVLLEEIELGEDNTVGSEGSWNVTFSYDDSPDFVYPKKRKYKTVILDARDGKFRAIKIREIK
jgi:hypothetical protein